MLAEAGAAPDITMLDTAERLPWAGHTARHALAEIYALIKRHKTTLLFVNTRSQAEMLFQELWRINDDNLPIALHHGSLDVGQRRKVEEAMAAGRLRAVVATSTLDLGIDWGDVDLVINVGAPKGATRLLQRIGRANHRMDEPSKGVLVPANRFEVLECRAALDAVAANAQDTPPLRIGALDVLAQHVLGCACGAPFVADELYRRGDHRRALRGARRAPTSTPRRFRRDRRLCAAVLRALRQDQADARTARWRIAQSARRAAIPAERRHHRRKPTAEGAARSRARAAKMIPRGGRLLGQIEEYFVETLTPGDTFLFAGEVLRFEGIGENEVYVSRAHDDGPEGAVLRRRQVSALDLSRRPRARHPRRPRRVARAADQVRDWLEVQEYRSRLPGTRELLVETFPRAANITWSAIRSRAGSRTRRSACC